MTLTFLHCGLDTVHCCVLVTKFPSCATLKDHFVLMMSTTLHYGLTGGWVQNFKASYLLCFLHSALVFKARGQCDHHASPWHNLSLNTVLNNPDMKP